MLKRFKEIEYFCHEKPKGEIMAGAGVGTSGATMALQLKKIII